MDVSVAAVGLLLALPLMLVAALAIKLTSRGPVFFRRSGSAAASVASGSTSSGRWSRTPRSGRRELRAQSAHPAWLLLERDPRVTRVGRLCAGPASTSCRSWST